MNRLDEDRSIELARGDAGLWAFPQLEALREVVERVLGLCAERPDLPHTKLVLLAKERWGMTRASYYRALGGRLCAHSPTG